LLNAHAVVFVTHGELRTKLDPIQGLEFRALDYPCLQDCDNATSIVKGRRNEWEQAADLSRDASVLAFNLFAMPVGIHLGEKLNVPAVCLSPCLLPYECPPNFRRDFEARFPEIQYREEFTEWLWPIFTETHADFREFLGLPAIPLLETEWTLPQLIIGIDPDWLQVVEGDVSDMQPLLPHKKDWLQCFRRVAQVSQLRIWIQWQDDDDITPLQRVGHLPFVEAFSKVRCVLHHGGLGTTAEALRAGKPQIIMPIMFDQPFWAAHVERLHFGFQLDPWQKPVMVDVMRCVQRALALDVQAVSFRAPDMDSLLPSEVMPGASETAAESAKLK